MTNLLIKKKEGLIIWMFIATFSVNWFIFYVCSYDIFIICFRVILSVATARITLKNAMNSTRYLFCMYTYSFFKKSIFQVHFPFLYKCMATSFVWVNKPVYLKHIAILLFFVSLPTKCCIGFILRYIYTTHIHLFIVTFCCEYFLIFSIFLLKLVFGLTSLFDQIYF